MAAIKALEKWCKMQCDGYQDVAITNMTTSFRNGMAFCALIHTYRPDLIDYDSLNKEDVFKNNNLAFRVAEEKLGIPALLDAEDMVALKVPDRLSILTYVSQYYNYFHGRAPMGGVKRPAEGTKEEPSKKNLPVVAKTFVSKTAPERCLPSTHVAGTSPNSARAAVEIASTAGTAGKSGTLNSKCVSCNGHVHLVQRHFVEGRLYHRSCFKCSDCSGTLRAGAYIVGKEPDTFVCKSHRDTQNSGTKAFSSRAVIEIDRPTSFMRPNCASQSPPACRTASALTAPVNVVHKTAESAPLSQPWRLSAQRTQAARQRFFQTAVPVEVSVGNGKPPGPSSTLGHSKGRNVKGISRAVISNKLAEENCNNNNTCHFTVRSAKRRFEDDQKQDGGTGFKQDSNQGPTGKSNVQPTTNQTTVESSGLKAVQIDETRPTTVYTVATESVCRDWRSKLNPVQPEQGRGKLCSQGLPGPAEEREAEISPVPFSAVSLTTEVSPVTPLVDPAFWNRTPQKAHPASGDRVVPHSPGCPATQPLVCSPLTSANPEDLHLSSSPGSKKGKYLSPTNTSRTEMRSTIIRRHHIPMDQIAKELDDIEAKLGLLEKEGVELERRLRSCEEDAGGDILMDPLMADWFNLIRKKQMYIRQESELVYTARTQDLELQQPGVEGELRRLLEKPDHLKSTAEQRQEQRLLDRLMKIVNGRNAIVEVLDEDRRREVEEDQQLNEMMQNLGVKKSTKKRKSSISKLFRRKSKRLVD